MSIQPALAVPALAVVEPAPDVEALIERFRGRIGRLAQTLPDAEIVCTGPWPPYSFVEGAAHA